MSPVSHTSLQFAVVREDPRVERALVQELRPRRVLLIASGGCTALALRAWFDGLRITLLEPNEAQLEHVQRKLDGLSDFRPEQFNIGSDAPEGLHECGNFERLFRHFRSCLGHFVIRGEEIADRLVAADASWDDVFQHAYWPVVFELTFADPLLRTMFGPDAVQHAVPGSYPGYFRRRIEDGLRAADRASNPWLHHVLLGRYLEDRDAWPPFLREPLADLRPFEVVKSTLLELPTFAPFDLVHLSNVMDWMSEDGCRVLAQRMIQEMQPGAAVLWRQLNDPRRLTALFEAGFRFDAARDGELTSLERSLFYDQVHVGIRI